MLVVLVYEVTMIYDILIKNEALEVFWLILASLLGLFYYLFILKFRKRIAKQKINILSLVIVVWVIGFIFNLMYDVGFDMYSLIFIN